MKLTISPGFKNDFSHQASRAPSLGACSLHKEIHGIISRICPSRPKISRILHGVHVQAQNHQIQHRKHIQGRDAPL